MDDEYAGDFRVPRSCELIHALDNGAHVLREGYPIDHALIEILAHLGRLGRIHDKAAAHVDAEITNALDVLERHVTVGTYDLVRCLAACKLREHEPLELVHLRAESLKPHALDIGCVDEAQLASRWVSRPRDPEGRARQTQDRRQRNVQDPGCFLARNPDSRIELVL